MRKLPIFTFINKMDRPALEPLELMDQIEKEFNLPTYPVNWPIGSGDRYFFVALNFSFSVFVVSILPSMTKWNRIQTHC